MRWYSLPVIGPRTAVGTSFMPINLYPDAWTPSLGVTDPFFWQVGKQVSRLVVKDK